MMHSPAAVEEAAASAAGEEDFMGAVCVRAATGAGQSRDVPVGIGAGPLGIEAEPSLDVPAHMGSPAADTDIVQSLGGR